MKYFVILIGFLIFSSNPISASIPVLIEKKAPSDTVPPSFNGDKVSLITFIAKNVKYPPMALENNVQGTVVLRFTVTRNGDVENIVVISKKKKPILEMEAIRVLKKTNGRWNPATAFGEAISMSMVVPIKFRLY